MNADLPAQLAARLQQPLPGWSAQARLQPELSFGRHRGPAPVNARPAAVLLLLYPQAGQWHLPLIVRPLHMPDHAGQVSFPGGVIEPGETSREAALREFVEELGASADQFEVLGELTPLYLFASNFQVIPWVAAAREVPAWKPSPGEVDRLLEVPLTHLFDSRSLDHVERRQRALAFRAPCFVYEEQRIWGATSMILAELLATVEPLLGHRQDCRVDESILTFTGRVRIFESQDSAVAAILADQIVAGDVVLIRYEGPKGGPGMQEMLYPTSYLKSKGLGKACALADRWPLLRRHLWPVHWPRQPGSRRRRADWPGRRRRYAGNQYPGAHHSPGGQRRGAGRTPCGHAGAGGRRLEAGQP